MDFIQKLSGPQKLSLSFFALFITAVFIAGGIWILTPRHENLYEHVDTRIAAQAARQLDEAGVPYEIIEDNGNNTIKVAEGEADRLRVTLSDTLGLPQVTGLEIFDNADYSMTDFSQQIAYQRAIQGELSRTLTDMNGIRNARIHLSLAPQKLFKLEKQTSKAAVYLELEQGVAPEVINPVAIQQIVSHAVTDLPANNVTVFDQHGNELTTSDIGNNNATLNKRLELVSQREAKLTAQIYQLLGLLFNPQDIAVSVVVTMNFDQRKQRVEELLTNGNGEGVVVRSKQQQVNEAIQVEEQGLQNTPVNTQSETEYRHGNELVETVFSPGVVEQISVGIMVNGDLSDHEKAKITQLLSAGVGINPTRGDQLVFEAIPKTHRQSQTDFQTDTTQASTQKSSRLTPAAPAQDVAAPTINSTLNLSRSGLISPSNLMIAMTSLLLLMVFIAVFFIVRRRQVRDDALRDISNWMGEKNA